MTLNDDSTSVIITGSTGMIGEGVLHVCLGDTRIKNILVDYKDLGKYYFN